MLNELRAYIIADPAVAALIGTRFYPTTLPQNVTLPAVSYVPVSAVRRPTMRHADNLPMRRIQIDTWSKRVDEARNVADAIRSLFHYYDGEITGIQGIFIDDEREDYESTTTLYRVSADYLVHYAES